MFDLLKNKLSSFVNTLVGKTEAQAKPESTEKDVPRPEPIPQKFEEKNELIESVEQTTELKPLVQVEVSATNEIGLPKATDSVKVVDESVSMPKAFEVQPSVSIAAETPVVQQSHPIPAAKPVEPSKPVVVNPVHSKPVEPAKQFVQVSKPAVSTEPTKMIAVPKPEAKVGAEIQLAPKVGLFKQITSFFSSDVTLTAVEVEPALGELEMALLESDVSFDASQFIVGDLRKRLEGRKVNKARAGDEIKSVVKESLLSTLKVEQFDFFNYVAAIKAKGEVAVILFVGPNGSGKTTTIAKLAKHLQDRNISTVIAAGDTFRRAAIEQAQLHGDKIGVRVVKHAYGADPTAVAFDAIAHAKASGAACVLIDTAGRQETNYNLVKEMEKMDRVLKPHLKIFVGEAIAGNALVEQVKKFNESVKLDGIILTKLDCDAKGGGSLSIAFETKLPVLFIGVGQEYGDLRTFDAEWIVNNVFMAS